MTPKQPKQTSGGGWHISPLGKPSGRNLIMKSVAEEFRQALNACGKMSIQLTDQLTPSIQYSQDNIVFKIPRSAVQSSGSTSLPWQIERQAAANTIQVGGGEVYVSTVGFYGHGRVHNQRNAGVDIVLGESYYIFYLKVYNDGSSDVAEVNYLDPAIDPKPTEWTDHPAPQNIDTGIPGFTQTGYVLVGYVDNSDGQMDVYQTLFHNPSLLDYSLSGMVTTIGNIFGGIAWLSGQIYRKDAIVTHAGSMWHRYSTDNGNNGGEPGVGTNSWDLLP